jgi:hypothetical protein
MAVDFLGMPLLIAFAVLLIARIRNRTLAKADLVFAASLFCRSSFSSVSKISVLGFFLPHTFCLAVGSFFQSITLILPA